jgi:hypothetical protein
MSRPLVDTGSLEDVLESECLEAGYRMAGCTPAPRPAPGSQALEEALRAHYWALAEVQGFDRLEGTAARIAEAYCKTEPRLFNLLVALRGSVYAVLCSGGHPRAVRLAASSGLDGAALVTVNLLGLCKLAGTPCALVEALVSAGAFIERASRLPGVRSALPSRLDDWPISPPYSIWAGELAWGASR